VHAAEALVAASLAPRCVVCARVLDAPLAGAVCDTCWEQTRLGSGTYDGPLRQIIHAFKYEGRRSLARPLGNLMRSRGVEVLRDANCVVPVPLHPFRRIRRGFNQAADLARHTDVPVVHALWRVHATASQTGLNAVERRRNVGGAFRLSPLLSRRLLRTLIHGGVVVLIDDVTTTGATLAACAEVLQRAGAREVRTLTLARALLRT
jgi:ComF family protein